MSILRMLKTTSQARRICNLICDKSHSSIRTTLPKLYRTDCRFYASIRSHRLQRNSNFNEKKWLVPIGIGVAILSILQWKILKDYTDVDKDSEAIEPINEFMVVCYSCLPLRITSRFWGWIAQLEVPASLRPTIYNLYAKIYHANLEEIDSDLTEFPSLVDFFVRPLKDGVRPIASNSNFVSPADGKVLQCGPVTSCCIEQVKGVTYNLRHFLGHPTWLTSMDQRTNIEEIDDCGYLNLLLKNPANKLYQLIIYLAPGDYHRFHSPTNWQMNFRRHFQGELLSVSPQVASWVPNLFALNERVIYVGEWMEGFMAYIAVGATNVGSIKVYCDEKLATNTKKWSRDKHADDVVFGCTDMSKGQMLGEFRMGSTIVLLFEAPPDFKFSLEQGQSIKMGQALCELNNSLKQRSPA